MKKTYACAALSMVTVSFFTSLAAMAYIDPGLDDLWVKLGACIAQASAEGKCDGDAARELQSKMLGISQVELKSDRPESRVIFAGPAIRAFTVDDERFASTGFGHIGCWQSVKSGWFSRSITIYECELSKSAEDFLQKHR